MTKRWFEEVGRQIGAGLLDEIRSERPRPVSDVPRVRNITSLDQLGSVWQKQASMDWLVPDLIAEGSVNLLASESGTGKTWLAYFLAGCVARGSQVFGKQAAKRKVLYLDGENPLFVVKDRLDNLGIEDTPNLKIWGGWEVDPPPGPDDSLIVEFAKKERPLLIWDSLVQFHPGDEQSATATRQFMRQFRELAHTGATTLILHNTGKSESSQEYRGSSDIKAVVDSAFKLKSVVKDQTRLDRLTLDPFKCRLAPLQPMGLRYIQGKGFAKTDYAAPADTKPDAPEVVRGIVEANPGLNQTEIVERAQGEGIAKHKAEDALKDEVVFTSTKGPGNSRLYSLAEPITRLVPREAA